MPAFDAVVRAEAPDQPILVVTGDLDLSSVPLFMATATDVLNREGVPSLALDLSRVGGIDSTAINAVTKLVEVARASGRNVALAGCSPYVERVLRLVGLDEMFA